MTTMKPAVQTNSGIRHHVLTWDSLSILLDLSYEAVVVYDEEFRFVYINAEAERQMGRLAAELIGQRLWDIFPETAGVFHSPLTQALREQITTTFDLEYAPANTKVEGRCIPLDPMKHGGGALAVLFRDVTEQRAAANALYASEERVRLAVEGSEIGTWHWDIPKNELFWSVTTRNLLGLPAVETPDYEMFMNAIHPEDRARTQQAVEAALASKAGYDVEYRAVWPDGSLHWQISRGRCYYDESGAAVRMEGILIDITERKNAEQDLRFRAERESLLNKIQQAIRSTIDPEEIQRVAVRELGEILHVDRCYFSQYDMAADQCLVGDDFRREGIPSLAGEYKVSQFQVDPADYYPRGETLIIDDLATWRFPEPLVAALSQLRVRSAFAIPFFVDGTLAATLSVAMADAPRRWTADEVSLAEAVASQTRSAVEAARLLAEQQTRLKREALVGRIGVAIRSGLDPGTIQETAATLLAEALGADRCFYLTYDLVRNVVEVGRDFHRADLPALAGEYHLPDFEEILDKIFHAKNAAAISDVRAQCSSDDAEVFERFQHRAVLAAPFFDDGRLVATLWASMADAPRRWTTDEVFLLEQVATQTRTALETARISRREHTIAEQLQVALQPEIPKHAAGLELAGYYRPALEEAGVGGDFTDVFAVDNEATFLIVGDLSGKGLAAASQVAMVRHMLRFALYNGRTVAGPVTRLNATLADHGLLGGFSTLFVGRYDAQSSALTYVNCGQDPGLILRKRSKQVEKMPPTGPVLGAFIGGEYSENTVLLETGDVLALFTDGLTEAGPSRTDLLTGDGVAKLIANQKDHNDAQSIVERLIADVDAYAEQGVRDDQCLLIAVVKR